MDPILQQLQQYYQQQRQQYEVPMLPEQILGENMRGSAFNPWWLKLRQRLHHDIIDNTQVATKYFNPAND